MLQEKQAEKKRIFKTTPNTHIELHGMAHLLHDARALLGDHRLLRHGHGAILQRVVRLPEQILAIVLQALVGGAHHDDGQHRGDQAADAGDAPLVDQDGFRVAKVEL